MKFTPEQDKLLQSSFDKMSNKEIAAKMGLKLHAVRSRLYELGLYRMNLEYWTDEQTNLLIDNYQFIGDKELAKIFDQLFSKAKGWTLKHIEKKRKYLGLKRTQKELKEIRERNRQAGCWSINHWKRWVDAKPIGTIVTWCGNGRKRQYIKTESGYETLARYNWTKTYGPIPEGMNIRLKDGDYKNCDPSNLECVDNAEHAIKNGASIKLSDNYIAAMLTPKDPYKRNLVRKNKTIIELKRTQLILNREINKQNEKGREVR